MGKATPAERPPYLRLMELASDFKKRLRAKPVEFMPQNLIRFFSYRFHRVYLQARLKAVIERDLASIKQALKTLPPVNTAAVHSISRDARLSDHSSERWVQLLPLVIQMAEDRLGLQAYDVQIKAALYMLHGALIEVETGEGKTLSIALAASCAALAGEKVQVITANDYLAQRDLQLNLALFSALGLTASCITSRSHLAERRQNYCADILYSTSKEVTADHLRDQLSLRQHGGSRESAYLSYLTQPQSSIALSILQSEKGFVFIDEVDSCLIDEAITPLILSRQNEESAFYHQARDIWRLSQTIPADDYKVVPQSKKCLITGDLEAFLLREHPTWVQSQKKGYLREVMKLIPTALEAQHVYKRNVDYKVSDQKIVIIDQASGRLMENRTWSKGLHQFIELKEGIHNKSEVITEAKITFQNYFKMYGQIAGASGTLNEERREIWDFYRRIVVKVERHFPCRRTNSGTKLTPNKSAQLAQLLEKVQRKSDQPVLVGCHSVESSQEVYDYLVRQGLNANILNADSEEDEALIIAEAGKAGKITVGTQMVGRGTDIQLDDKARAAGGLCTILLEHHHNSRVDRQFFGRSARQQDPGERLEIFTADQSILKPRFMSRLLQNPFCLSLLRPYIILKIRVQQRRQMRKSRQARYALQRHSEQFELKMGYVKY